MARPTPEKSSYDDFSDSAPSSDSDPYNQTDAAYTYQIDSQNLPKSMPFFGAIFGYNDARLARHASSKLQQASIGVSRALTKDEMNAMVFYSSKQLAIMSYGAPLGLAGAFWRAYTTRASYRFPFYKPDLAKFSFDAFPTSKLAVVRGVPAMMMWHGLRFFTYGYIGRLIGEILLGTYGASVALVGEMQDSRLRSYIEERRKVIQADLNSKSDGIEQRGRSQPVPQIGQVGGVAQDDASPTGGMFGQDDTAPQDDNGSPQPNPQRTSWARRTPSSQASQTPVQDTQAESKPFDMFDDASPTSGAQQGMMEDTQPRQSQSSGSAWDRIRRGDRPPPPARQAPRSQVQSPEQRGDNDYMRSQRSEESKYTKEQAQKEFDAQIERERSGGDFSGGAAKKW